MGENLVAPKEGDGGILDTNANLLPVDLKRTVLSNPDPIVEDTVEAGSLADDLDAGVDIVRDVVISEGR